MKTKSVIKCECGFAYDGNKFLECPQKFTHTPAAKRDEGMREHGEHTPTHTPTAWKQTKGKPWSLEDHLGQNFLNLSTPHERLAEFEANAAFIVRAVNAHEELIQAIKGALESTEIHHGQFKDFEMPTIKGDLRTMLETVLARAEQMPLTLPK